MLGLTQRLAIRFKGQHITELIFMDPLTVRTDHPGNNLDLLDHLTNNHLPPPRLPLNWIPMMLWRPREGNGCGLRRDRSGSGLAVSHSHRSSNRTTQSTQGLMTLVGSTSLMVPGLERRLLGDPPPPPPSQDTSLVEELVLESSCLLLKEWERQGIREVTIQAGWICRMEQESRRHKLGLPGALHPTTTSVNLTWTISIVISRIV